MRLPPAVMLDLPVLLILMVCWATIAVALAHLITGLALTAMIVVHLASRRRRVGRLFRSLGSSHAPVTARKVVWRIGYLLFLVVATAMVVSGLLRWADVPRLYAQHATSSYALLTLVVVHLVVVRRPLRARLRRRKNPNKMNGSDS